MITRPSICPNDCPSTCGLLIDIEEGKVVGVHADPTHPVSCNGICHKTQHYEEDINSPNRILTPLKRTGKKGSGEFTPISWDEAVTEITDTWKKIIAEHGAQAILPVFYSGVMSNIQRHCGDALFAKMGACGLIKTICSPAKGTGFSQVAGNTAGLDPRECNDSDFYIIWGANMPATRLQMLADLQKPENRGKKKILIDTYKNPTAKYCDETILIRSGQDGALVLAMIHVLDKEGLVDEAFMQEYCDGYDEFRATLGKYTPEWAEGITGIPAETIRRLAMEYGQAKAPAIIYGSGASRHGNGAMTSRLITILSLVTGAWKQPGGGLCGGNPHSTGYLNTDLILRPDFREAPARMINLNQVAATLNLTGDDKIYSTYIYAGNPANTLSNQKALYEGLAREDLFTVVHERFMTDSARYADIILPATFSVEQPDIYTCYGYCTLGTAKKLVDPPGECKSNWDTFALLAKAMGYDDPYFKRTEEEMLDYILDNLKEGKPPLTDAQKQRLRDGLSISLALGDHLRIKTKSKKFMIVNEKLADPIPRYMEDYAAHDPYPLKLVVGPSRHTLNSLFTYRESLAAKRGSMKLLIHPEDAAARGIVNGQTIIVYNDLAEVAFEAYVTEDTMKGNVISIGIFTSKQSINGLGSNALHHERLSDYGAGTTLCDNGVEVRAAD